jgi:hypothetical protein
LTTSIARKAKEEVLKKEKKQKALRNKIIRLRSHSVASKNSFIPQRVRDSEDAILKSAKPSAREGGSKTAMSNHDDLPMPSTGIGSTAGSTM